jgi:hypothetical protein
MLRFFGLFLLLIVLIVSFHTLSRWQKESVSLFDTPEKLIESPLPHLENRALDVVTWDGVLWENNGACLQCHPRQAEEWKESQHRWSFDDPLYRLQVQSQSGSFDCLACHLSRPVYEHPLGIVPPRREIPHRETYKKDGRTFGKMIPGVTCLTCHVKGRQVMGSRDIPEAPCRVKAESSLKSAEMCHGCHQAYGKTNTRHEYDEWLERKPANRNKNCQDCHMPLVNNARVLGTSDSSGFDHSFFVWRFSKGQGRALSVNRDLFNRFFEARLERRSAHEFELILENKGTAHGFPSGYTIRSVDIFLKGPASNEEKDREIIRHYPLRKASPFGGTKTQMEDFEIKRVPLGDLSTYSEIELSAFYTPHFLHFLTAQLQPFFVKTYRPKTMTVRSSPP